MATPLHVCLYNTDPASSEELRSAIGQLNFVRLAAEVTTSDELLPVIEQNNVNLVFFHLDPFASPVVKVIDETSARYPELAMVAISGQIAPEAILAPMRAGCDQFVCKPIDHNDLANAVARVANKRLLSHPQGRCVCVTPASGGCGSTSIACNLALEIGNTVNATCAVVDLDFQFGDVSGSFDCEPRYSFFDLAESGAVLDRSILRTTLVELPCKVAVLGRPERPEQSEAIGPDVVHHAIEVLTNTFENVVVDVPRHLDQCVLTALKQADKILVVCQLLVPSIRNAKRYFEAMTREGIAEERIEVVVNRSDSGGRRITNKDLEETIRKPIFASVPNDYEFVARSLDYGRPVAALERNNPVRAAIRKIARQITADPNGTPAKNAAQRGILRRLFIKNEPR